jgi:hypothetical protein
MGEACDVGSPRADENRGEDGITSEGMVDSID